MKEDDQVWIAVSRNTERPGRVLEYMPFSDKFLVETDAGQTLTVTPDQLRPFSSLAESGGTKHDTGKPDLSLIPYHAECGIALALMDGEKKYGRYNYLKGMKWSRLVGAAKRHLGAFQNGENVAEDSQLNHLYHAAANICMLIEYYEKQIGEDDRNKNA